MRGLQRSGSGTVGKGRTGVDKTLLVAEATFERAGPHVGGVFLGMTVTLVAGFAILGMGLAPWLTIPLLLALLIGLALLKARFGPLEMRVEKFDDEDVARIAGRFSNAVIRDRNSRDVATAVIEDGGDLRIDLADEGEPRSVWLRQPSFRAASLATVAGLINDLHTKPRNDIEREYKAADNGLKVYDARGMLLMRLTEKPSYMAMMWLVAGLTVLFWMALMPLLM